MKKTRYDLDLHDEGALRKRAGNIAMRLVREILKYDSDTFSGGSVTNKQAQRMAIAMLRDGAEVVDGIQLGAYADAERVRR